MAVCSRGWDKICFSFLVLSIPRLIASGLLIILLSSNGVVFLNGLSGSDGRKVFISSWVAAELVKLNFMCFLTDISESTS